MALPWQPGRINFTCIRAITFTMWFYASCGFPLNSPGATEPEKGPVSFQHKNGNEAGNIYPSGRRPPCTKKSFFDVERPYIALLTAVPHHKEKIMKRFDDEWPDNRLEFIPCYLTEVASSNMFAFFSSRIIHKEDFSAKEGGTAMDVHGSRRGEKLLRGNGSGFLLLPDSYDGFFHGGYQDAFTVSCLLSHRRLWELMLARSDPVSLVLEHDAVLAPWAKEMFKNDVDYAIRVILNTADKYARGWDYLQIGRCWDSCLSDEVVYQSSEFDFKIVKSLAPLWTIAALGRLGLVNIYSVTTRLFDQDRYGDPDKHGLENDLPECNTYPQAAEVATKLHEAYSHGLNSVISDIDLDIAMAFNEHWSGSWLAPLFTDVKTSQMMKVLGNDKCDYKALANACKVVGGGHDRGHYKSDIAQAFLKYADSLGVKGFVVYDLKTADHTHKYVHRAIYNNFLDAASSSDTAMHVCWIEPDDFSPDCSLGQLFLQDGSKKMGSSLVFTSPKRENEF
eukprot:UC4_evm1s1256